MQLLFEKYKELYIILYIILYNNYASKKSYNTSSKTCIS